MYDHHSCAGYAWYYHFGVPGLGGFSTCYFDQGNLATFGNSRLVFQPDGNLVIYNNNYGIWSSSTWSSCNGGGQQKVLTFQQDGNLVIYCTCQTSMYALWSTNTWMR